MTELLIAWICATTIWLLFRVFAPKRAMLAGHPATGGLAPKGLTRGVLPAAFDLLARIGKRLGGDHDSVRRLLAAAGLETARTDVFQGARICAAIIGALLGLVAGPVPMLGSGIGGLAGYRLPLLVIRIKSRRRRDETAEALPDAVDLLAVCTQAGLNLSLSLERVADSAPGLLGTQLRQTVEEINMGVPRSSALASLAQRSQVEEIDALVATLISAERFGTQVSASLATFAGEVRQRRRRSAEEQARRAPVKILFPLIFLILPAFVMLTVVPLILGALKALDF